MVAADLVVVVDSEVAVVDWVEAVDSVAVVDLVVAVVGSVVDLVD